MLLVRPVDGFPPTEVPTEEGLYWNLSRKSQQVEKMYTINRREI